MGVGKAASEHYQSVGGGSLGDTAGTGGLRSSPRQWVGQAVETDFDATVGAEANLSRAFKPGPSAGGDQLALLEIF